MKTKKRNLPFKVFLSITILIALLAVFYLIANAITAYTGFSISEKSVGKEILFRECLNDKDITLYINSEEPYNTLKTNIQIEEKYLEDIRIFNCLMDNNECITNGIDSFPTWMINNNKISRDISLAELEQFSGCRLE